jgi:hypothetical protein
VYPQKIEPSYALEEVLDEREKFKLEPHLKSAGDGMTEINFTQNSKKYEKFSLFHLHIWQIFTHLIYHTTRFRLYNLPHSWVQIS